jgi:AAA15 family ATPase/GTPase
MLVNFSIENWMSFRDPITFSMIASRESRHSGRVPQIGKYKARILPIAAIYGGNASGKTNFFKALNFVKELVTTGTQPDSLIPVEVFLLDAQSVERPSRFTVELLIDENMYEFSFALTKKAVIEEKLVQIKAASEKVLYHRHNGKLNFDKSLTDQQFLKFVFKGTRDNQLFLTNSISQNVEDFRPIYNWFKDTLELVAPDSRFGPFEQFLDKTHHLYATMNEILPLLDTGISHLGGEDIPFENIPLPEFMKKKLDTEVREGMTVRLMNQERRIVVTRKNGQLAAQKLVTYHLKTDGTDAKFEISQESDGSQRIIDLLPAFLEISATHSKKVYVIDEVDRSLHTQLTRRMLESYLDNCSPESRAQLLLTTHDVLLMDQQLLRRDEMWVTEREPSGISTLFSFSEYKDIRYDKDIRKSYLQGRLGGIPRLLLGGDFMNPETEEYEEG